GPRRAAGRAGDRALAHQALLAADQREGGAPAADDGSGVGSRAELSIKRRSSSGAATLARPLQREPSSLSSRQPPAYGSRSGRLGARHLGSHGPEISQRRSNGHQTNEPTKADLRRSRR